VLTPLALFGYLLFIRTRGITESFLLLSDQILYWNMALGPWSELPYGGGPSSAGGTTLGPIFVWTMWGIRVVLGPWMDNLPHAGGIGLSIIQSAADAMLFVALRRKTDSTALSLAITLVAASSPFDLSLTAAIWNPPLAVAFVKAAIALVLLGGTRESMWWGLGATSLGVLAVQAHSSAVFFAAPVAASFVLQELAARRWRQGFERARAALEVVVVLELPFFLNLIVNRPQQVGPSIVIGDVRASVGDPSRLQAARAFTEMTAAIERILFEPMNIIGFGALLTLASAVVVYRHRKNLPLAGVTVLPMLCAAIGFAAWQRPFDTYWFMTLAPSAAVTLGLALAEWRPTVRVVGAVLLAAVVVAQPARVRASRAFHHLPEYGALLRGARGILARTPEVRSIHTEFALHPASDPAYLYRLLGGALSPEARFSAVITRSGEVLFRAVEN
jgi:hypothetical protein